MTNRHSGFPEISRAASIYRRSLDEQQLRVRTSLALLQCRDFPLHSLNCFSLSARLVVGSTMSQPCPTRENFGGEEGISTCRQGEAARNHCRSRKGARCSAVISDACHTTRNNNHSSQSVSLNDAYNFTSKYQPFPTNSRPSMMMYACPNPRCTKTIFSQGHVMCEPARRI